MKLLDLLKADTDAIRRALLDRSFYMVEEDDAFCRIVTDDLTVWVGWDYRDQEMLSSIEPCTHPEIFIEASAKVKTELWLRPSQEDIAARPSGPLSKSLLQFELGLIGKAVATVFSDASQVRDKLIYVLGFYDGYTKGRKDAR